MEDRVRESRRSQLGMCVLFVFLLESSYVFHDGDDGLITDNDDTDTGAFEFVVFEYEEDARS